MNTDKEIRDWYAGQALTGILSRYHVTDPKDTGTAAEIAFAFADAMMAERQKRNVAAQKESVKSV